MQIEKKLNQQLKQQEDAMKRMNEQSEEEIIPIEYCEPTIRTRTQLEQTKESEKGEFHNSEIICKNDHKSKCSVTPGMFVFSCVHCVILGKSKNNKGNKILN